MLQEISTTKSRILGALSKLDTFLLHSQVLVQSGSLPGTSRDTFREEMQLEQDCAQNDSHPEVDRTLSRSLIG